MAATDNDSNYLSLMDRRIKSIQELSMNAQVLSINLHCNLISKIEGLLHLHRLQHLDLSSNFLTKIEGLDSLINLQSLNLASNRLTAIEGMQNLINLKNVNFSYNRIYKLHGLIPLHGRNHVLSHIYLQGNSIGKLEEIVTSLKGLQSLEYLTLQDVHKTNHVCEIAGYRELILQYLPQLKNLDGISRSGQSVLGLELDMAIQPNLGFLEDLVSCDSDPADKDLKDLALHDSISVPVATPQIDKVLSQYRKQSITPGSGSTSSCTDVNSSSEQEKNQDANSPLGEMRIKKLEDQISELMKKASNSKSNQDEKILKPKRDTDLTTESDCESGKENMMPVTKRRSSPSSRKTSYIPISHVPQKRGVLKQSNARKAKTTSPHRKAETPSSLSSDRGDHSEHVKTTLSGTSRSPVRTRPALVSVSQPVEESTYRALVQELDQERERRWKAEQLVEKLSDAFKEIQRIKELLEKEKNAKASLQTLICQLKEENESLANETRKYASKEHEYQRTFKNMEDKVTMLETQRIQQEALAKAHMQEAELKLSAFRRENELLRASERKQRDKVQQLQDLLTSKEQAYRSEVDARVTLNGPEFHTAVAKEVSRAEWQHKHEIETFQEKVNTLMHQYATLEKEFASALRIESDRYNEIKEGFTVVSESLIEHKQALTLSQSREKEAASLVGELASVVKDQKAKIEFLTESKQDSVRSLKRRIHNLETVVEEEKRKTVQLELLKQEKAKLLSQLTAQESLIDGLKAERKLWGQELSQQGASLAQDRGRLEAKIEFLSTEIETLKKQNERDNDTLKIKSKMVDDQTETIRKLKEALQERDEHIRKLRAESLEIEKTLREQNDEKATQLQELEEKLEKLTARRKEIKLQLEEKEAELLHMKESYSAMNKKWQNKEELLSQLERQVKQMKVNFDAKEKKLIEERDQSLEKQKAVMEKLRSVDDAFRRQLEAVLAANKEELVKVESEKQKELDAANEKVYHVEEEMRQLLQETAKSKKILEEKVKRLTSALHDVQEDL